MTASADHYATLGVTRDADFIAIRAAYRALAKHYHPDTSQEPKQAAEAFFHKIHEAYETLSDAQPRAAYNLYLDQLGPDPVLTAILNEAPSSRRAHTKYRNHQGKRWRNRRRLVVAVRKATQGIIAILVAAFIVSVLLLAVISAVGLWLIGIVVGVAGD